MFVTGVFKFEAPALGVAVAEDEEEEEAPSVRPTPAAGVVLTGVRAALAMGGCFEGVAVAFTGERDWEETSSSFHSDKRGEPREKGRGGKGRLRRRVGLEMKTWVNNAQCSLKNLHFSGSLCSLGQA